MKQLCNDDALPCCSEWERVAIVTRSSECVHMLLFINVHIVRPGLSLWLLIIQRLKYAVVKRFELVEMFMFPLRSESESVCCGLTLTWLAKTAVETWKSTNQNYSFICSLISLWQWNGNISSLSLIIFFLQIRRTVCSLSRLEKVRGGWRVATSCSHVQ